jgi:asparagine synthetase B (glutamine-hydrolysing)
MNDSMRARGPDAEGVFAQGRIGLGHRRLSILDLAPASQQPLADDPVKRVDNMTMAFGLEARVPYLDHEVVELASRLPAALKVSGGGKHILKKMARRYVPSEVIDRSKGYFPLPSLRYLNGPFLDFVRDTVTSAKARERGCIGTASSITCCNTPNLK